MYRSNSKYINIQIKITLKGIETDLTCSFNNGVLNITNGLKSAVIAKNTVVTLTISGFNSPYSTEPISAV